MKNKIIFVVIVIVLIGCVLSIWLVSTHRKGQSKEETAVEEAIPHQVEKSKKSEVRMPIIELEMAINGRMDPELAFGTPIFITVSLRNASAHFAAQTQSLIKYYSDKSFSRKKKNIQRKILDSLQKEKEETPDRTVTLRSEHYDILEWITFQILADGNYQPLPWNIEALEIPEGQKIALDGKTMVVLEYAVPPEAASRIAPADYTIRARLIAGLASDVKEGLDSDAVHLKIIEQEKASERMLQERMLLCGRYYLKKGDLTAAGQYVLQLRDSYPRYIPGLMLTGEIYEEMGKDNEAYLAYQEAMNILADKNAKAPPPFLIEKINKFLFTSK